MEFKVGQGSVTVNVRDGEGLVGAVAERLSRGEGFAVATLNLDHLVKLRADPAFRAAYAMQDLVTADGNPIVWLARAARSDLELVPGSDLVRPLLRLAAREGAPVAFLGSTDDALEAAAGAVRAEIPDLDLRACVAPPMGFDPEGPEAQAMLDDLARRGVRLVMLALGAPKQERLAAMGRARHPSLGFVSVGAGLDFLAGAQRRAPRALRGLALEWLWRMALSPRRLGPRYLRCALILPGHLASALSRRWDREAPARRRA